MLKSSDCFYSRTGFNSQHPHDGSISSITPILGDLMAYSDYS